MNHSLKRFNQFIAENEDRLGRLAQLGLTTDLIRLQHKAASLVKEAGESSITIDNEMLSYAKSGFDYDYDLGNWFSAHFDGDVFSSGSQADAIKMLGQEGLISNETEEMDEAEYEEACLRQMEYNWEQIYTQISFEVMHTGEVRVHGEFYARSGPDNDFNRLVPEEGYSLDELGASESDQELIYSDIVSILEIMNTDLEDHL